MLEIMSEIDDNLKLYYIFAASKLLIKSEICKNMKYNLAFSKYIRSLSSRERIAKLRDIRQGLNKTPQIVLNWRLGRTVLDQSYFDKISDIVGVDLNNYVDN